MNLEKMLAAQAEFDNHIVEKKGLQGVDLVPNTFVALQVELGEMANEGRWFKHWSNNQKPRIESYVECSACNGTGDLNYEMLQEDAEGNGDHEYIDCPDCDCSGFSGTKNPLLEEFADCVHLFLSVAIQKGWQGNLYIYEEAIEDLRTDGLDGGLTGAFLEMMYFLTKSIFEKTRIKKIEQAFGISTQEFHFKQAWFVFIAIGLIGFGFTLEQIEEAYWSKNKVNYQRQQEGY